MTYFDARPSDRRHNPATNWNLWAFGGDVWTNVATAPMEAEAMQSRKYWPHCTRFEAVYGTRRPE